MFDHLFFNRLIMVLYASNVLVNLWTGHWWDAGYWLSALGITFTVTFGYH